MFDSLGYSKSLFESFSFGNILNSFGLGECKDPSCDSKCVNCRDGCNQGPDGGEAEEPI